MEPRASAQEPWPTEATTKACGWIEHVKVPVDISYVSGQVLVTQGLLAE